MSKLKEMKKKADKKNGIDFTYVFFGVVALLVLAIVYFSFIANPNPLDNFDLEDDDPVKGPTDAKVTLVEFSDFECPACGAMYPVLKRLSQDYPQQIKFVYRDFPLSSIHPFAQKAAEAAECADRQGKFWEYHDKLFENQQRLEISDLKQYAVDLGLGAANFNQCLDGGEATQEIANDLGDAQTLGLRGTPTFFINRVQFSSMTYDQFKILVDKEIAK